MKKKTKEYKLLLPTDNWLIPIKKMVTDDVNTFGLLMIAKYLRANKQAIVKITRNANFKKIIMINNLIGGLPNFVVTFASFFCMESDFVLQSLYEDFTGFCTQHKSDVDNTEINLEVMKMYSNSFKKYTNKPNLKFIKLFSM